MQNCGQQINLEKEVNVNHIVIFVFWVILSDFEDEVGEFVEDVGLILLYPFSSLP